MREAYERCRARKVAPKVAISIPEPEGLKVMIGEDKQTESSEFCRQAATNYNQLQKKRNVY